MSVRSDRIRENMSALLNAVCITWRREGKGEVSRTLLKPLTQEPQSSRKLFDQVVRPKGRHGQTCVFL